MHNDIIQNDMGQLKREYCVIENNPHKAFVESLKKQLSSCASSAETDSVSGGATSEDAFSINFIKTLEAGLNHLYADLNGDD